jgi:hypothetical protein
VRPRRCCDRACLLILQVKTLKGMYPEPDSCQHSTSGASLRLMLEMFRGKVPRIESSAHHKTPITRDILYKPFDQSLLVRQRMRRIL